MSNQNALAALKDLVSTQLERQIAAIPPSAFPKISFSTDKRWTLPDGRVTIEPFDVLLLGFQKYRAYYAKRWTPGSKELPTCWALMPDEHEESARPHDSVANPVSDACETCPMNQWGSGASGKNKACAEKIRLAVLPAADYAKANPTVLDLPPTSRKPFFDVMLNLATKKLPLQVVKYTVDFSPSATYPCPILTPSGPIDDDMATVITRHMSGTITALEVNLSPRDE